LKPFVIFKAEDEDVKRGQGLAKQDMQIMIVNIVRRQNGPSPDQQLVCQNSHCPAVHGASIVQVHLLLVLLRLVFVGAVQHLMPAAAAAGWAGRHSSPQHGIKQILNTQQGVMAS
jgi:hypothetical protein